MELSLSFPLYNPCFVTIFKLINSLSYVSIGFGAFYLVGGLLLILGLSLCGIALNKLITAYLIFLLLC